MKNFAELQQRVIEGNAQEVELLTRRAIDEGSRPSGLLEEGLIPAMAEVGRRMSCQEYFIPEVLMSAEAMYAGLSILRPLLTDAESPAAGTVVLGTMKGDIHDIGKNLVAMMLEGGGFRVVDLGINVEASRFVDAVREHGPNLVGMSAMLTTTMTEMQKAIAALTEAGLRDSVGILIGGAPVSEGYAERIGADCYCRDCSVVVDKARALLKRYPGRR